jgi:putative membrane protein
MPSENRLHPYSILFAFLTQIRLFVVPGIFVMMGSSSRGDGWWTPWMMLLIIPNAIVAVLRYVTFRYRYDESDMVIRSGLVFRKERHIPYARIQNIDAVQNLLHRLLHVVEVKVETGGGETAEARMSVLPMAAFHEMRAHVFAQHRDASVDAPAVPKPPEAALLQLGTRELLLYGFIDNRGAVVVGAALGVLWEFGLVDWLAPDVFDGPVRGRGAVRNLIRDVIADVTVSIDRILIGIAVLGALLLLVRVLSMGWAAVRLHGFRLSLIDGDARTEYGLLTRVAATIPLRRIQTLSIRETPMHRLFTRVAVKADTAGGRVEEGGRKTDREWLAPILRRPALPDFVRALLGHAYDAVDWRPVAPGAFRREVKGWLFVAALMFTGLAYLARWWAVPVLPLLILWAALCAHQTIKHLGWAITDEAVVFKRGWLWRRVVIVRFAKIQTVSIAESPFDRRTAMAAVHVDTAGASERSVVHIPYLARDTAAALHARLAREAAQRQFKW